MNAPKLLLMIAVLCSVVLILASGSISANHSDATFDVTFVNCSGEPEATTLAIHDMKSQTAAVTVTAIAHSATSSEFRGILPAGLYGFWVHTGRCYGGGAVALLTRLTHHVAIGGTLEPTPEPLPSGEVLLGHDELRSDGVYALAGRLPLDGLSIRILDSCGASYPVSVDNRAYYEDSIPPGDYLIWVNGTSGGTIARVRVARKNAVTVRDFSLRDVESGKWVDLEPVACTTKNP